jgi:hypothetical protein
MATFSDDEYIIQRIQIYTGRMNGKIVRGDKLSSLEAGERKHLHKLYSTRAYCITIAPVVTTE